ncbi:MAG TPA: class I SAM-dependent methyltransferase [Chlamydiales bacterium]|nr:class I SAM-dependent methyltransferase [Chlamydiales bacterium]
MKLWIWFFLFGTVYAGDAEMKKSYVRDMSIPPDFSLVPACYGKVANEDCPLIQHVQEGIEQASREMGRLSLEVLKIDGMTSAKGRYLLNHLCSLPNAVYLEIGSWKGSSFVSALYHNEGLRKSYAIEKWVRFADNGFDFGDVRDEFYANVRAHLQGLSFKVFENDCFSLNLNEIPEKITIYFYDGEHRKKDQKEAFTYFNDRLASEFIAIVDDWNWESTRSGTFEAFDQLGYKVLFEQYLPANFDGDTANWWNGMYVAVIRKSK